MRASLAPTTRSPRPQKRTRASKTRTTARSNVPRMTGSPKPSMSGSVDRGVPMPVNMTTRGKAAHRAKRLRTPKPSAPARSRKIAAGTATRVTRLRNRAKLRAMRRDWYKHRSTRARIRPTRLRRNPLPPRPMLSRKRIGIPSTPHRFPRALRVSPPPIAASRRHSRKACSTKHHRSQHPPPKDRTRLLNRRHTTTRLHPRPAAPAQTAKLRPRRLNRPRPAATATLNINHPRTHDRPNSRPCRRNKLNPPHTHSRTRKPPFRNHRPAPTTAARNPISATIRLSTTPDASTPPSLPATLAETQMLPVPTRRRAPTRHADAPIRPLSP